MTLTTLQFVKFILNPAVGASSGPASGLVSRCAWTGVGPKNGEIHTEIRPDPDIRPDPSRPGSLAAILHNQGRFTRGARTASVNDSQSTMLIERYLGSSPFAKESGFPGRYLALSAV